MKTYTVRIQGITPLMHHRMPEEELMGLLGTKDSIKRVKRVYNSPREIAERYAYQYKNKECYIPAGYIMGAFIQCSADFKRADSSRKSLKSIAGGSITIGQRNINLINPKNGKVLKDFEVDIQKATNHLKGAVAVCRPRFDEWGAEFSVEIDEDMISVETVQQILEHAGRRVGIGSFRVSKSGFYGRFRLEEFKLIPDKSKPVRKKKTV